MSFLLSKANGGIFNTCVYKTEKPALAGRLLYV